MLETLVDKPFRKPGWIFEEKYDGDRILAYKEGNRVRLVSRNGKDRTARFPRIAAALAALSANTLLLDGEIVALDSHGISRFQLLQQAKGDPVYVVFDCLFRNGKDLRDKPLSVRRSVMENAIGSWWIRRAQRTWSSSTPSLSPRSHSRSGRRIGSSVNPCFSDCAMTRARERSSCRDSRIGDHGLDRLAPRGIPSLYLPAYVVVRISFEVRVE
jgi:hypothetical protein